jgi:hypothetical protein
VSSLRNWLSTSPQDDISGNKFGHVFAKCAQLLLAWTAIVHDQTPSFRNIAAFAQNVEGNLAQ